MFSYLMFLFHSSSSLDGRKGFTQMDALSTLTTVRLHHSLHCFNAYIHAVSEVHFKNIKNFDNNSSVYQQVLD